MRDFESNFKELDQDTMEEDLTSIEYVKIKFLIILFNEKFLIILLYFCNVLFYIRC